MTLVNIPGYCIDEELYNGSRTLVYRGYREQDSLPVVLKLLKNPYPSFSELVQFRNQYTIAKNLNFPGIIQTYSLEPYQNGYVLVMEDFGGISLSNWCRKWMVETGYIVSLQEFLEIAIALADILNILYRERVIHKDIKPSNILINPQTKQIKLIDFSIASLLPRETQTIISPNILEGTLAYISPEQTGRMNRLIDYRTDFYSLGVTFYELLTGELPFPSKDAMELVHCHIAKMPESVNSQEIPQVLDDIIQKLMAKNTEDRYQSALGLKTDLEKCLQQLTETGRIDSFKIAQQDVSDRFIIPDKLYGRETEVQILLDAFERVSNAAAEIMLVAGFSGIGKTAVINELHKPIVRQRGYFIKGKYEQFNCNIPLSAFVQAFRDLMGQLITENEAQIQQWKNKILEVLGENGQVIIEVIPELERIIGRQPPAPKLSGNAAQNRFNLLFQKFVQIFTIKEHPLVMFLDDLQWADSASLNLLKVLIQNTRYLLILGAYRDNEVSSVHPFILTLDEIIKTGATVNIIPLPTLSETEINKLVADTLNCESYLALPLTKLVYQKTQGNPFFATQFLKALHDEKLIQFNWKIQHWQCDIAQIEALAFTDDVVEFMALQLQKLSIQTQEILRLAACIGTEFDLNTLAIVSEKSSVSTATALWKALQEGLVIPTTKIYKFFTQSDSEEVLNNSVNPTYQFLHDRVQQAAYLLIPEEQKKSTHLNIGKLLQNNLSETAKEAKLFDIVGHLNLAQELIHQPEERENLAQLNLAAGCKARNSTAYTAARNFVQIGLDLLAANCWEIQYELALNLYVIAAETAYLSGDFESMEELAVKVLQAAQTTLDKVKIYEIQIAAQTLQSNVLGAIATGRKALSQLGVELPSEPDEAKIGKALQNLATQLENIQIAELVDLPLTTDATTQAAMQLMGMLFSPIIQGMPSLLPLLSSTMVSLSLESGNSLASTIGYAIHGMVMSAFLGDAVAGYAFGKLALNLLEKFNKQEIKTIVMFLCGCFIQHHQEPLSATIPILKTAYHTGIETGNFVHAGFALATHSNARFFSGAELDSFIQDMADYSVALAQIKQYSAQVYVDLAKQLAENLIKPVSQPHSLIGDAYNEIVMLPKHHQDNDLTAIAEVYVYKLLLAYSFGYYTDAINYVDQVKPYLMALSGTPFIPVFHFYAALAYLAVYPIKPENEQAEILAILQTHQTILHQWAQNAPMNHLHKWYLVEADKQQVLEQKFIAADLYDRAISGAKENSYIQEEALANELAAKFYLDWGKEKVAQAYMQEAYYCYARWGAKAKTDDVEKRYPQLLKFILHQRQLKINPLEIITTATITSYNQQTSSSSYNTDFSTSLDFEAILKASRMLSSAIHLEELITNLMQVLLQNSGAQKIAFILPEKADWVVACVVTIDDLEEGKSIIFSSQTLENSADVPIKMFYAVKHTLQAIIIHDIKRETQWLADSYIQKYLPKSAVCTPIVNQGRLMGVLYLENSLTTGVFTSDRIEFLNLLCAQAAISLENARLYAEAQEKSQALQQSEKRYRFLATATSQIIWLANTAGENVDTVHWREYTGQTEAEVQGIGWLNAIHPDDILDTTEGWTHALQTKSVYNTEYRIRGADGNYRYFAVRGVPLLAEDGSVDEWIGTCTDIDDRKKAEVAIKQKSQELEKALRDLQQAQLQIVQNEKMSALGNLVAGVAHEMNNPLGFISASLQQVKPTIADIFEHLKLYQQSFPKPGNVIIAHSAKIDLEYTLEDLPKIIDSMEIACDRLKNISTSLRTFSRADKDYKVPFDIHEGIDSTILILKHRLKANDERPAIEVVTEYGNLPKIKCFSGQLNQVFMNIVANAIDALDDANVGRNFAEIKLNPNKIIIKTIVENQHVKISIVDNGKGMSEEIQQKIFDHLFTTKPVGKGTGLGLAIAKQIIVEKHGGKIEVNSQLGKGTEFVILLPLLI